MTSLPISRLGTDLDCASRPQVMGILNVTPDSFSDGGRFYSTTHAVDRALAMIGEGADIIDIGGESTRPGSDAVDAAEEIARILPVLSAIRMQSDIPISVDTRKATVALEALDAGADIINDISALRHDPGMVDVIRAHACPVILMHMLGTPATMQDAPMYSDVVSDIAEFFRERLDFCHARGVDHVLIDPGICFGKRLEDNLALLKNLNEFERFDVPIVVGTSRKSFLGHITGTDAAERGPATLAADIVAMLHGASVLRVHDVKEHVDALRVVQAITAKWNRKAE